MTVKELSVYTKSTLKVMSGYNGKVLCHAFKPDNEKHAAIGKREVISVWADVQAVKGAYGGITRAIFCCYAGGAEEYAKEHRSAEAGEGFYDQA